MDFQPFYIFKFHAAFWTLICVGWRTIIIILAGLERYCIVRFGGCKPFTAKDVTEVLCPPVAYQRNILENSVHLSEA